MFELDYWIEGIITKKWVLVSLDLDKRIKSYGYLKNQGQAVLREKNSYGLGSNVYIRRLIDNLIILSY